MSWIPEDYTIHERRTWRKVRPQDQIPVTMTPRKLTAICYKAASQLAELIAAGKATPPTCQFNRGGFDADRLPPRKERPQSLGKTSDSLTTTEKPNARQRRSSRQGRAC